MKILRNIVLLSFVVAMISAAFPALADSNCNASENYYRLGNEQYQTGNFQEAINSFTCVIERNTEDAAAYNLRGNAYRSIEQFDLALADYNSAIEHDEAYAIAFNNRGWTYYNLDDLDRALIDFDRAIDLDPSLAYAYNNRGLIYQIRGENALAAEDFTRALELHIEPASWTQYNLDLLQLTSDKGGFETTVVESIESNVNALSADADRLYNLYDFEGAVVAYTAVISADANNAHAFYFRGRSNIALDRFEDALADFERLVDLRPDFTYAYWERAIAYAENGEFDKANADLQRAMRDDSTHVNNFIAGGTIATLSGDPSAAGAEFLKLMETWETQRIVRNALESGETTSVVMRQGNVYAIPFNATAGQTLLVQANSQRADPVIVILDPNGQPVNGDDDSGEGIGSHICGFELVESGEYAILVSHAGGGSYGTIDVILELSPLDA
jgi:tetratricopeptide (TPR) repeat protein